ncbi:MAG: ABC-2 family transporter protein [Lachnospiraceae bacterium]|nr:ABC-2 family transporter protein [Lachnospiraceae bacterium]
MRKSLRIYLPFALNELKRQLAYKGAFYLFILVHLFGSFISYYLWMAIYGSAEKPTLGGLTQKEMVVYVFMVYVTASIVTASISTIVSDDVVKGAVAMNLIKPIDYRISLIAMAAGNMVYRFLMPSVYIWIGLEIYKVTVLGMEPVTVLGVLLYLLSCMMSFLIYVLFDFCFGMIAFFTTYIFGMRIAKEALLSFLTGQLIPISFFSDTIQRVFDFLPFSSMVYTPVMIYLGKYTGSTLVYMMLRQAVWVVILYAAGSLIWRKVTKRLVVLGG